MLLAITASLLVICQSMQPTAPGATVSTGAQPATYTLDAAHAYTSPTPISEIQTVDLTLTDAARKKDMELRVRAPKLTAVKDEAPGEAGGTTALRVPLIIFSHGAGGANDAFPELSSHLASLGYVVVHPTHSDSIALRRRQGEDLSHLRENPNRLLADIDAPDRLADVSFVIDSIRLIEAELNKDRVGFTPLAIDQDRIGMAGHSAGAYTTQVALGAKVRGVRWGRALRSRAHSEPRIKAGVLISGQGTTNRSLSEGSWSEIATPMLVIAGSLDVSRISNETPESRREPYEKAPPGDKYLIYINGATHGSYQGKGLATMLRENPTTDIAVITAAVSSGTTAFFDRHLKGLDAATTYLESDDISKLTSGAAEFQRK